MESVNVSENSNLKDNTSKLQLAFKENGEERTPAVHIADNQSSSFGSC